ncbi:MAG: biopolymer transporter ExbD [Candidatus Omnitrophica bacterium]|nr:biopolymer transporter ExbD [Candidatus Omnitrophota bacterium]
MQFKRHAKFSLGFEQINIAPLVDVIFQLLIFFMLSSSFVFQSGIKVRLPKAITSEVIKEENLIITLTSENVLYINSRVSTMKDLKEELAKKENKERLILIKADRRSSLGRVIDIWDLCRELGIERVNIATNQEK